MLRSHRVFGAPKLSKPRNYFLHEGLKAEIVRISDAVVSYGTGYPKLRERLVSAAFPGFSPGFEQHIEHIAKHVHVAKPDTFDHISLDLLNVPTVLRG